MYKAVVIGTSSGGMNALKTILPSLPGHFALPVIVVQHIGAQSDNYWISVLDSLCQLKVKEADEKEPIEKGTIYIAPPNYHLLVERDKTLSLTIEERVNYARPSIDVLFETAALAYGKELIGVVLTGANHDGANGLKKIKDAGGFAIVEDPNTAEARFMPASAISAVKPDYILPLAKISALLVKIAQL